MFSWELLFLFACLFLSSVVIAFGTPLLNGWVPPNGIYGFRNAQTLRDSQVWYLANRVCGFWMIVAGVATAGVAAGLYAAGIPLPYVLFFTLVALVTGVTVMLVKSDAASRQPVGEAQKLRLQFGLLALFVVTTLVAIGCAIARLPAPWIFKVAVLSAYVICIAGLLLRNRHPDRTTDDESA